MKQGVIKKGEHVFVAGRTGSGKVLSKNKQEVQSFVEKFIGKRFITYQTTADGQPVDKILLESPSEIERELYLAMMIDRASRGLTIVASTEGGVDTEAVAATHPEKIFKISLQTVVRVLPYQARIIGFQLGLTNSQISSFYKILKGAVDAFFEKDLSLLEINPLVVTKSGELLCLDAKITIDDNALYRQSELAAIRDLGQEDDREALAKQWELSYIALEGNIGCMVNGAYRDWETQ